MAHISQIHGDLSTISCLQRHSTICSEPQKEEGVRNWTKVMFYYPHLGGFTAQMGLQWLKKLLSVSSFSVGYVTLPCSESHTQLPGLSWHVTTGWTTVTCSCIGASSQSLLQMPRQGVLHYFPALTSFHGKL